MTINALAGPIITYQDGGILPNTSANQNPDQAPSLFLQSVALLDPRQNFTYFPGDTNLIGFTSAGVAINSAPVFGWLNASFLTADYAPSTASTVSLVAAATVSSTSITMVASSGAGITVNSGLTVPNASGNTTSSGLWLIDSKPGWVTNPIGSIALWDPTNPPVSRAVTITSSASVAAINFTISGYDSYGYPIVQTLAGPASAATVTTTKTFKWVSSITCSATTTTTVSIGHTDVYGLPMFCSVIGYLDLFFNNVSIYSSTTPSAFVAGTTLTTAGAGDVRGTYNISTGLGGAANGTKTLQIWQAISVANISTATGLFGVTPA